MLKIKIKRKTYEMPTSWDEITMKQYCHLFYKLPTVDSKSSEEERTIQTIRNEGVIISRLLGQDDDFVLGLPIQVFVMVQHHASFIYSINDFLESGIFSLNIDGRRYRMVDVSEMSLRQYIDADMIMKDGDSEGQFIELLACLLLEDGKEYDGNYKGLIPKIEGMSAADGLPFIYSFFKKKELSKRVSEASSKVEEMANRVLQHTQGS